MFLFYHALRGTGATACYRCHYTANLLPRSTGIGRTQDYHGDGSADLQILGLAGMHRQSVGEFHYHADHKRVMLAAILQEIRDMSRIGNRFRNTIKLKVGYPDMHQRINLDVAEPVCCGATPCANPISSIDLFVLEWRHVANS